MPGALRLLEPAGGAFCAVEFRDLLHPHEAQPLHALAGAARAEMETALRGQSWPVTRDDPIDGNAARHEHDKGENPCTLDSAKASSD